MKSFRRILRLAIVAGLIATSVGTSQAADLTYPGSQYDVGTTNFPTYNYPQNSIVPWRSDVEENVYSVSSDIGQRYYGTAGYALFGTRFSFPNADEHPPAGNAFINPTQPHPDYPDIISLPSFVTNSQIFASRIAAGWAYALIDDPRLQAGPMLWTFDGVDYPAPTGPCPGENCNVTGVNPYVKLGILDGLDILGNNPTVQDPSQPAGVGFLTYRWGFEVGANVPASFRVGVMTDGLDHPTNFTPTEVHLQHVDASNPTTPTILSTVSTGVIPNGFGFEGTEDYIPGRNRFVDMHFFDITGAQPGDQFVFAVRSELGSGRSAGISAFTFDVIDPTTQGVPGDYNNDGEVNAADYSVWRDHLGQTFQLDNEGPDTPGSVTAEDYDFWKSQFGGGGSGAAAAGVPEPGSIVLLMMAAGALAVRRRRD